MLPVLFSFGDIIVPAWHTFYVLGAMAAYLNLRRLTARHCQHIDLRFVAQLFSVCYVAGYFGARLLSIFIDESDLVTTADRLMALVKFGPMTFYGGFIGALTAGTILIHFQRKPFRDLLDVSLPSGLIALAIGRIGCFLNGDDFGKQVDTLPGESAPWWSVTFPNLEDGIARYPVQLMESALALTIALFLMANFVSIRTSRGPGSVGIIGLFGYGFVRFFLEYLRGDDRGWVIENTLSPSQLISLIFMAGAAIGWSLNLLAANRQSKLP